MLEFLIVNKPAYFATHLGRLFDNLPLVENHSVMRHYSKMIALLTGKNVNPIYLTALTKVNFEPVIETLFMWLVAERTLVASKVHCMQALANLSKRFNWITEELMQTIIHLESKESIAFFARAKVVKKTLIKQNRMAETIFLLTNRK